jgi:hypothetical protein
MTIAIRVSLTRYPLPLHIPDRPRHVDENRPFRDPQLQTPTLVDEFPDLDPRIVPDRPHGPPRRSD